jgi:hypothetical protein
MFTDVSEMLAEIALMTEAANTSEVLVNLYQTIRRNNPEDGHLHTRPRENLNSHMLRHFLYEFFFF